MRRRVAMSLLPFAMAPVAFGQEPVNLIKNGDFELGMSSWTVSATTETVQAQYYGLADYNVLSVDVSKKINGAGRYLQSTVAGGIGTSTLVAIEQKSEPFPVDLSGKNLYVRGFFGGITNCVAGTTSAQLSVRFLKQDSTPLPNVLPVELPAVLQTTRNYESVLMLRQRLVPIPAGAARALARIELRGYTAGAFCYVGIAAVDNILLAVVDGPIPPPSPLPVDYDLVGGDDTELLFNGDFESGWSGSSPISLNEPNGMDCVKGWEGVDDEELEVTKNQVYVRPYGTTFTVPASFSFDTPTSDVGHLVGGLGNANILSHVDTISAYAGDSRIHQRLDLRGNAAEPGGFDNLLLRVSACLGGVGDFGNGAQVIVRFVDGDQTLGTISLGPVTRAMRNFETIVMMREADYVIPPQTSFVDVEVDLVQKNDLLQLVKWYYPLALADQVSVRLVPKPSSATASLEKNLIKNPSFESSKAQAGSPIEPGNPRGWVGNSDQHPSLVGVYGDDADLPDSEFSSDMKLGPQALGGPTQSISAGETCSLIQTFDVSGYAEAIDGKRMSGTLSAWLGSAPGSLDTAQVIAHQKKSNGSPAGNVELPPVSSKQLQDGYGLIPESQDFPIAPGTRSIEVEVLLTNSSNGAIQSYADKISLKLHSTVASCDGGKVKAAGKYLYSVLLADSDFVGAGLPTPDTTGKDKALVKAEKKLSKAFKVAEKDAQDHDGDCTYGGTSAQLAAGILGAAEGIVTDIKGGLNAASGNDLALRSKVILLAGKYFKSALKAEASNIQKPDAKALVSKLLDARGKFMASADEAISIAASQGVIYSGAGVVDIADSVEQEIKAVVDLLH